MMEADWVEEHSAHTAATALANVAEGVWIESVTPPLAAYNGHTSSDVDTFLQDFDDADRKEYCFALDAICIGTMLRPGTFASQLTMNDNCECQIGRRQRCIILRLPMQEEDSHAGGNLVKARLDFAAIADVILVDCCSTGDFISVYILASCPPKFFDV